MDKTSKILKELKTSTIKIGGSLYVRIPYIMIQDTSFPFPKVQKIKDHIHHPNILKIKMFKDKLIIEERVG